MSSRAFIVLLFAVVAACTEGNQEKPEAKDETLTDGDALGADSGDGGTTGDGMSDSLGDSDDGEDGAEQLVEDCGGSKLAESDPDEVVYDKTIKSQPIVKSFLGAKVSVTTSVAIEVTPTSYSQNATIDVTTTPAIGEELLEKIIGKQSSGKTVFSTVPFDEYSNLSENEAWEGVLCTFVPAVKVENERGGKTVAEFDPPLPINVSPRAVKSRYDEEIGSKKVFRKIKAKVISSDEKALKNVTSLEGTVTVEKVDAKTEIVTSDGTTLKINADLAYRMTTDFGSPEITLALGLSPEITYYISHGKKDLLANVVDMKDKIAGKVIFVHE